jgi:hypothetical protein
MLLPAGPWIHLVAWVGLWAVLQVAGWVIWVVVVWVVVVVGSAAWVAAALEEVWVAWVAAALEEVWVASVAAAAAWVVGWVVVPWGPGDPWVAVAWGAHLPSAWQVATALPAAAARAAADAWQLRAAWQQVAYPWWCWQRCCKGFDGCSNPSSGALQTVASAAGQLEQGVLKGTYRSPACSSHSMW